MDIRYSANERDVKRYTTQELRDEFLIENLYRADEVVPVYSHVDRMLVVGIMPVAQSVPLDRGIDVWKSLGTRSFLERREIGLFNVGGPGTCRVDGTAYAMGNKDCIYIAMGARDVTFQSDDAAHPAKFFGVSAPAHRAYETRHIRLQDAAKKPMGDQASSNKRVINQFIHPDVLPTCQLMMGLTVLESGNVWNTMPVHTHDRRMEVYTYVDVPDGEVVFHLMGAPSETRHIVMRDGDAVISPSWSIHAGCGTASYTFIWAMGGENQTFEDMDGVSTADLR